MDNMALIEMSSMHYINMPKIVSKAHFVALKFILYCIVRGKKTPILALTECLQNQTMFLAKIVFPTFCQFMVKLNLWRKNFNLDFDQVDNVNCVLGN